MRGERNPADGIAFLVSLWVTTADEHHTDGSTRIELNRALVEVACCHTFEEVYDVTLQTQHDTFRLRVTHTAVVFDHERFWLIAWGIGAIDEAKEDKALIVNAFSSETLYRRTDDTVFHLLHPFFGGERNRRDRPHTAGVQACVMLSDTLVVLGLGENLVMLSVGQDKDRALDATHKFLNDHL